jgi:predicted MPP superfamily phosphohydrolase
MRNIILQHWTGPMGELEKKSQKSIKAYAEFCGADYELVTGDVFRSGLSSPCQKMHMLSPKWDDYDIVVMMDIDMFTRKGLTKNIFTDDTGVGRHFGIQPSLRKKLCNRFPLLGDERYPYWGGSIYRLEKDIRIKLREQIHEHEIKQFHNNYEDEGIMHRLAVRADLKEDPSLYLDDDKWNRSSFEENVDEVYKIHVRRKMKNTPGRPSPKQDKILNYRKLVQKGIIE